MKDKDTVSPATFIVSGGGLENARKEIIRPYEERIAELEKENAELDASEAGWFNSCVEYQKENDALIIENCALESANAMFKKHLSDCSARLQKANQYLEANGMEVRF